MAMAMATTTTVGIVSALWSYKNTQEIHTHTAKTHTKNPTPNHPHAQQQQKAKIPANSEVVKLFQGCIFIALTYTQIHTCARASMVPCLASQRERETTRYQPRNAVSACMCSACVCIEPLWGHFIACWARQNIYTKRHVDGRRSARAVKSGYFIVRLCLFCRFVRRQTLITLKSYGWTGKATEEAKRL